MASTEGLFTTDKPYATASEHTGTAEQTTIEAAGTDEFNGESFAWVKLACVPKPIRLNKTNGRALVTFGNDTTDWINNSVFVTTADGAFDDGRKWTGWRLTPIQAKAQPAPVNHGVGADDASDIPF
jgi:hypothetical protein